MNPGDPVLLSGIYQMGGIGIDDGDCLVEIHGQYARIREADLIEAQPKPFPENLAVVAKEDLALACRRLEAAPYNSVALEQALVRLRTAVGEALPPVGWPPCAGDVWKDSETSVLWFAVQAFEGDPVMLVAQNGTRRIEAGGHPAIGRLTLAYRDGDWP